MSFLENRLFKKIIYIASITTACVTILGAIGWIYNEYNNYKQKTDSELNERINTLVDAKLNLFNNNINDKLLIIISDIDSLKHDMVNGSTYFAVGLRGDGSGRLWYRNEYGELFRAYYDTEYDIYYYINNQGLAVYL